MKKLLIILIVGVLLTGCYDVRDTDEAYYANKEGFNISEVTPYTDGVYGVWQDNNDNYNKIVCTDEVNTYLGRMCRAKNIIKHDMIHYQFNITNKTYCIDSVVEYDKDDEVITDKEYGCKENNSWAAVLPNTQIDIGYQFIKKFTNWEAVKPNTLMGRIYYFIIDLKYKIFQ